MIHMVALKLWKTYFIEIHQVLKLLTNAETKKARFKADADRKKDLFSFIYTTTRCDRVMPLDGILKKVNNKE